MPTDTYSVILTPWHFVYNDGPSPICPVCRRILNPGDEVDIEPLESGLSMVTHTECNQPEEDNAA